MMHAATIFSAVLPILLLRSLPFVLWILASEDFSLFSRLVSVTLYSLLVSAAYFANMDVQLLIGTSAITLGYFVIAASGVHCLLSLSRRIKIGRLLAFVLCLAPGLLAPNILIGDPYRTTVLIVGWEFTLSSYSYFIENRNSDVAPRLREALFFLVVNPTLVYSMRGRKTGEANLSARSWGRILLGIASVATCLGIRYVAIGQGLLVGFVLASPLATFLMVLSEYFVQSGRASIEIGLMRFLGWSIPERYRYPFLAKSPADFWRRWNIYIGLWVKEYLYLPLLKYIRKISPKTSRAVLTSIAAFAAFLFVGIYHDLCLSLRNPQAFVGGATFAFFINALALIAWRQSAMKLSVFIPKVFVNHQPLRVTLAAISCILCMTFFFSFGSFAFPLTSGKVSTLQTLWKLFG